MKSASSPSSMTSKLFMLVLLVLAILISSASSRVISAFEPLEKGGKYVQMEVGLAREPILTPPSPKANESPPGGSPGIHG